MPLVGSRWKARSISICLHMDVCVDCLSSLKIQWRQSYGGQQQPALLGWGATKPDHWQLFTAFPTPMPTDKQWPLSWPSSS